MRSAGCLFALGLIMAVPAPAMTKAFLASVPGGGVTMSIVVTLPVRVPQQELGSGTWFDQVVPESAFGIVGQRGAALSLFLADPFTVPLAGAGGVALTLAIAGRRRHRRMLAWGYVPPESLLRRLLALLR